MSLIQVIDVTLMGLLLSHFTTSRSTYYIEIPNGSATATTQQVKVDICRSGDWNFKHGN